MKCGPVEYERTAHRPRGIVYDAVTVVINAIANVLSIGGQIRVGIITIPVVLHNHQAEHAQIRVPAVSSSSGRTQTATRAPSIRTVMPPHPDWMQRRITNTLFTAVDER